MKFCLSLFCFLILLPCTCVRAQAPSARELLLDSLRSELQTIADRQPIPGFGITIVDANGPLIEEGYGYADLAKKTPYTPYTVQNIASISKTFIGIALLQAEADGFLKMDDPINKHLPFKVVHSRFPNQPILLKHLANHTSGISDDKNYDYSYVLTEPLTVKKGDVPKYEYREMFFATKTEKQKLGGFLKDFLVPRGAFYHKKNFTKNAPGAIHDYSNVGAALAAYVLEVATGKSFPEWTKTRIFQPAGMENTSWDRSGIEPGTRITHYFSNDVPMPDYILNTYPDGGLMTSIHGLGRHASATINGMKNGNDILSAENYKRLMSDAVRLPDNDAGYGYFWKRMDSGLYGHTGGDPGITTVMFIDENNGFGHLAFFNGTAKETGFYRRVVNLLFKYGKKIDNL